MAEVLYSSLLVLTVLSAATNVKVSGNSYFGVAIGFTIIAGTVAVGAISGGCFNPAIGIALPALSGKKPEDFWVFLVGDMIGAVAASALYVFWYHVEGDPNRKFVHAKLNHGSVDRDDKDGDIMRQGLLDDSEAVV